jgi:hypothetical protein
MKINKQVVVLTLCTLAASAAMVALLYFVSKLSHVLGAVISVLFFAAGLYATFDLSLGLKNKDREQEDDEPELSEDEQMQQAKLIVDALHTVGIDKDIIIITPYATITGTDEKTHLLALMCNAIVNDERMRFVAAEAVSAVLQNISVKPDNQSNE